MAKREMIIPEGQENIYTLRGYAPGVKVGNWLHVSGMLGRNSQLRVIENHEAQLVQMFENMKQVLEAAGGSFADVVKLTGFFIDLERDMALYRTVRDRYIPKDFPAQTIVGTPQLAMPGLLIELECVAYIPD